LDFKDELEYFGILRVDVAGNGECGVIFASSHGGERNQGEVC
jgi:hypothetical protein